MGWTMRRFAATFVLAGLMLAAVPTLAHAQGLYLGGALGVGTIKESIEGVSVIDDATFGVKLIAGYRAGFLAIEVDYRNLGTAKGVASGVETRTTGFTASLLGILPLGPVDVFARGGAFVHDIKLTLDPSAAQDELKDTTFLYGVGLAFHLGPITLRGEGEKLDIATQDTTWMYSLGATVAF